MRVAQRPQPQAAVFDFDKLVAEPGRRAMMELRGDPDAPRRRGPKRKPTEKIEFAKGMDYWTRALPALAAAYDHTCAYACVRLDAFLDGGTVDHWKPKSRCPDLAYRWDNFRYASRTMNTRKGDDEGLCDPFEVRHEWVVLNLVTFALSPAPAPGLDEATRRWVQYTLDVLQLDRQPMRARRLAAWNLYESAPSPYTWWLMARDCPLVVRRYVRQRGEPPPEALPLYTSPQPAAQTAPHLDAEPSPLPPSGPLPSVPQGEAGGADC